MPEASAESAASTRPKFDRLFTRFARAVRSRLLARSALIGASVGLVAGALGSGLLWWQREGALRPWAPAALGLAGALVGLVAAQRKRLRDAEVALYLDSRLGSNEAVATALELGRNGEVTPAAIEVVEAAAVRTLEDCDPKRARPRLYHRLFWLAPLGAAAAAAVSLAPLPPAPPAPVLAPGSERIKLEKLAGLERIEALEQLGAATPEERERLRRIAEAARKLKADLAQGMEKREALAAVARLRDDIAAERMKFGDAANRPGLDAAVAELQRHKGLERAARALGEGDLVAFDEEMQRIANLAESADRDAAKQALEEAAQAAKEKGAQALSQALERERKKLDEAQAKAEALRELARELGGQLGQEGQQALEDYGESGSPEAQRRLTESMERALRGLSDEERKRLAENLKKRANSGSGRLQPMTRAELEELARKLADKDADKELEEQLRELAKRDPTTDAERERGLGEADRGGAEAQKGLGAPIPSPGPGNAQQGNKGSQGPKQDPLQQKGGGGPGSKKDEGQGNHQGETKSPGGDALRSKAGAKLLPGASMHGATLGRTPARAGESANQLGTGSLGAVGPTEIGAVEGTDIPEEYREQVGRYFEP